MVVNGQKTGGLAKKAATSILLAVIPGMHDGQ
jgi:hypothetical protein